MPVMTLIEPVLVSVLRERGEDAAYAARRALGPTAQVYDLPVIPQAAARRRRSAA
jgi:hypothetical protein